jgi:hypothetical protein
MRRIHLSSSEHLSKDVSYLPRMAASYPFKPNGLWYAFEDSWRKWCVKHNAEELAAMYANRYDVYKYRYELRVDLGKMCVLGMWIL